MRIAFSGVHQIKFLAFGFVLNVYVSVFLILIVQIFLFQKMICFIAK